MLCPKCGKAELIGPYCPGCLSHLDDDLVGAPGTAPAAPLTSPRTNPNQRLAVLLAVALVMALAAVAAVAWSLTVLWIVLIPTAMITLILAVQIDD